MPSSPLWVHLLAYCLVISPHSSVALNPTPVTQPQLLSSKLRQHKTNRYVFLGQPSAYCGLIIFVQTLYVARRPERPGEKEKATQQQQLGQSQDQAQPSTLQTTLAVASTSTAPPQIDSITTSGAVVTESQPLTTSDSPTWRARLVFFVCCASINQYR
ncbi:hypothetical protein AZE42_02650 [Rhizopogon vesiculosus]|uniref:Uncharacterized protein n=1 Tax=Rhizopogon vesiculosus TaxID=180088 RepID=A0A1J8Q5K1_9AGAM|nr:hypothetical protein AZE42_02650 [Rhizopogon vesiculosus]